MSDKNLIDFSGLRYYTEKIKDYITNVALYSKADAVHSHSLSQIELPVGTTVIPATDVTRVKGFRNCYIPDNTSGSISVNTDIYDMVYIEMTGAVNISLVVDKVNSPTTARYLKVILKNPRHGVVWNDSANIKWMNSESEPTYTQEEDKVDIIDLVTANGTTWFASISKNY